MTARRPEGSVPVAEEATVGYCINTEWPGREPISLHTSGRRTDLLAARPSEE